MICIKYFNLYNKLFNTVKLLFTNKDVITRVKIQVSTWGMILKKIHANNC